ncbi:zf-HC2 domain-containing protein [Actinophytocola sediminis]
MSSVEHDRSVLGAYALGALDPAEERAVHAHVSTCPECQRELAEFVDLRQQLDQVPPEAFLDGPPDGGDFLLQNTLRRVRAADPPAAPKRSFGLIAAAVAVVAAVALGGGIVIGRQTAPEPATALPAGTVSAEATDPTTGASMRVEVEPRAGWVWVNAQIEGVPAGEKCELVVVPRDGEPLTAGSWVVSEKGEEEGLPLEGTALIPPGEVEEVRVVTLDGRTMVSVPL